MVAVSGELVECWFWLEPRAELQRTAITTASKPLLAGHLGSR